MEPLTLPVLLDHADMKAKSVDDLFNELDKNHDGTIDLAEFAAMDANKDGRIDLADMTEHPSDYISVKKVQTELAFRDEKRTACQAAVLFLLFNVFGYQYIIDSHVRTAIQAVVRGLCLTRGFFTWAQFQQNKAFQLTQVATLFSSAAAAVDEIEWRARVT
jgi:hypothetical protein